MKKPTPRQAIETVAKFNAKHPVGSPVQVRKDDGTILVTKTRSQAQLVPAGIPIIWVDGISGCYDLSRVEPIQDLLSA